MATYPYSPLDLAKNTIRLLLIQKGTGDDEIQCQLFKSFSTPDRAPAYKALSYTWGWAWPGDAPTTPSILIDSHRFNVTNNLHAALQHIRRWDQDVILWVDAICINQNDPKEKGHQVMQMGDVYAGAEEVLIWLGPGDGDTDLLLEFIARLERKAAECQTLGNMWNWRGLCRQLMDDLPEPKTGTGNQRSQVAVLKELLARPWFTRVWVLQEVARARTARVLCGASSCPARTFALMPSLIGLAVDEHTQAVLDIMPRVRRNTWWSASPSLQVLLRKFAKSRASHKRDKVYALLGLSHDASDPRRFYPCYQKLDAQVRRDTVSFLLFEEVLDENYSFPNFDWKALPLPVSQLAEITLNWGLGQRGDVRASARRTAELLLGRINKRHFDAGPLLLSLAEKHSKAYVDEVLDLLNQDDFHIGITPGDETDTLVVTSKQDGAAEPVRLPFLFRHSWSLAKPALPPPPFELRRDMAQSIVQLVQKDGSSKEEILRACVWGGYMSPVMMLLRSGVDVKTTDEHGVAALHLAARRNNMAMIDLLHGKGGDLGQKDKWGFGYRDYWDLGEMKWGDGVWAKQRKMDDELLGKMVKELLRLQRRDVVESGG